MGSGVRTSCQTADGGARVGFSMFRVRVGHSTHSSETGASGSVRTSILAPPDSLSVTLTVQP